MDIRAPNYKDGLLVNGAAFYVPDSAEVLKRQDLLMFEKMKILTHG
jgi:hypothetical protein